MKIVKPYHKILYPSTDVEWEDMLNNAEYCARVSHRSEDMINENSAQKLLKFIVMQKGDFSVIEHGMITVEFLVDRGITHELVRHRLFSFTQESTRFVNYEKKMPPSFIYPQVGVECEHCLAGNEPGMGCKYDADWLTNIRHCEISYKKLIAKGWRPQEARSVFPNALASKITVTGNPRNWRHLLNMRTSAETHPQFRQVTLPLLKDLVENQFYGWLFEDIIPGGKQSEMQHNMR